ncbi:MAG: isoprenylcysteine carboxylmethyltransferase family protein [Holophagales bacterium]|nr:isoprenylcysteine carboxylmethyltransferase family protein [Holophagales bacterium]
MLLLLKNLLFTLVVPGTVGVYLPLWIAGDRGPTSGTLLVLAIVLFGAGLTIYGWCVWDFATFGRATPAPVDAPKRLVVRGLYRYTRNPMYLGVLAVISGWALLYRSHQLVLYALGVATMFHLFIVLYEEPHLRKVFGEEYELYREITPRWLPSLRRPEA